MRTIDRKGRVVIMDKLMNAEQLAKYVGECWGGNSEKFIECFSEDGVIEHPFFQNQYLQKLP